MKRSIEEGGGVPGVARILRPKRQVRKTSTFLT